MKQIVKAPLVTEKNTYHNAAGVYVFEVDLKADKAEIKAAVESGFGVKVDDIRTAVCRGKTKATRQGITKRTYWKKAFVKLKAGEKIALFEGV